MKKRTVMIFPEFNNINLIDDIRKKYDPLADLVLPHITLVFPFESDMDNGEIKSHLERYLKDVLPFKIKLGGYRKQQNNYGNFLFLNMVQGTAEIENIHKLLYKGKFRHFDTGEGYVPHMTVGKFSSLELLDKAFNDVNKQHTKYCTVVKKISVEEIGYNNESIIVLEHDLSL